MSRSEPWPNEIPVKTYPTPSWGEPVDELLVERIEFNKNDYIKLKEGTPHPNTRDFPNHKLLKETWDGQYGISTRYWCNGYTAEDQYNYDISYSAESNSHPIFTRRYKVRRDQYAPTIKATAFSGVYLIKVTNPGSGYDPDQPPTVTISGGGGSGATAVSIVGNDGTIGWIYLTNEGTGYISTPAVTIGSGTATAVAITSLATSIVSSVTITNVGTGYPAATTISFSGGSPSVPATAVVQVFAGKIRGVTMTSFGFGYQSTPSVNFSGAGGSLGAGTAVRETVTPVLVKEDVQEFAEDDPRRSLYVAVVRTWETLPGPVLVQHDYDDFINDYITIKKQIIAASQVPPSPHYTTVVPGQITEYQPLSKYRSVKIDSSISFAITWEGGAADFVYEGTANFSFPNEIREDPIYRGISAFSDGNLAVDLELTFNVIEGYSGPCRAIFTRRFTLDPTNPAFIAALPTVTVINPQAHVIYGEFGYAGGNLIAREFAFSLPSALHPLLTPVIPGAVDPAAGGSFTTSIPATVPPSLPSGSSIIASVKPEQWRFQLWVYTFVEIFVP